MKIYGSRSSDDKETGLIYQKISLHILLRFIRSNGKTLGERHRKQETLNTLTIHVWYQSERIIAGQKDPNMTLQSHTQPMSLKQTPPSVLSVGVINTFSGRGSCASPRLLDLNILIFPNFDQLR